MTAALTLPMAAVPASARQGTPAATPSGGGWPRTVDGAFGSVTIPARPERVVAVSDWYEVDYLMAQYVAPVLYGYSNRFGMGVSPWLSDAGGDSLVTYDLEGSGEPDLEGIALAQPDLIVADPYIAEQVVDQLNGIAPTVGLPTPYTGSTDWREGQTLTGLATGDEAEAAAAIAETEAAIEAGRSALAPHADRTVTIAYTSAYNGGSLFFAQEDGQEAGLIRELGVQFRGFTDNSPQSMENVSLLADADIVVTYGGPGNEEVLEGSELFRSLDIASNGQYVALTEIEARALFAPSTLSVRWVTPRLVEAILLAAAGNGRIVGP